MQFFCFHVLHTKAVQHRSVNSMVAKAVGTSFSIRWMFLNFFAFKVQGPLCIGYFSVDEKQQQQNGERKKNEGKLRNAANPQIVDHNPHICHCKYFHTLNAYAVCLAWKMLTVHTVCYDDIVRENRNWSCYCLGFFFPLARCSSIVFHPIIYFIVSEALAAMLFYHNACGKFVFSDGWPSQELNIKFTCTHTYRENVKKEKGKS